MLAEHQTFVGLELHIEGVLAGAGHFIHLAVHHGAAALDGVLPVHRAHNALPQDALVGAGADDHRHVHAEVPGVLLVHDAAHPEVALLSDDDEGLGLAGLGVGLPVGVDLLDVARHRAEHVGVGHAGLGAVDLLLLGGDLVFRLLDVELELLDLEGVLELVGAVGGLLLLFQGGDLGLLGGDGVVHLLDLELHALDLDAEGLRLIGKQHLPLAHRVAGLHRDLGDLEACVLIHADGFPRLDDAGIAVVHADGADAEDLRDRHHRDLLSGRAAGQADCQTDGGQKDTCRSVPHG